MLTRENSQGDFALLAKSYVKAGSIGALEQMVLTDPRLYRLKEHVAKAATSSDATAPLGVLFGQAEGFRQTLDASFLDVVRARPAPVLVPLVIGATVTAGIIAERAKLPVLLSLEQTSMSYVKTGGLSVFTKDQVQSNAPGAESFVSTSLRGGITQCSNRAGIEALLSGPLTTDITASGSTASDILTDLASASNGFDLDSASNLYLLASPQRVKNLCLKNGGGVLSFPACGPRGGEIVPNITALACPGWPEDDSNGSYAVLLDAGGLLLNRGDIYLGASDDASLELIDPDGAPETTGISLFQTDCRALKYIRTFSLLAIRNCVTVIHAIEW